MIFSVVQQKGNLMSFHKVFPSSIFPVFPQKHFIIQSTGGAHDQNFCNPITCFVVFPGAVELLSI